MPRFGNERSLLYALVDRWQEAEDWEPIMAADDPFHSHCECRPLVCVFVLVLLHCGRTHVSRFQRKTCHTGLLLHHCALLLQMGCAGVAKVRAPYWLLGRSATYGWPMPAARNVLSSGSGCGTTSR
jgi:hypothetical protein